MPYIIETQAQHNNLLLCVPLLRTTASCAEAIGEAGRQSYKYPLPSLQVGAVADFFKMTDCIDHDIATHSEPSAPNIFAHRVPACCTGFGHVALPM